MPTALAYTSPDASSTLRSTTRIPAGSDAVSFAKGSEGTPRARHAAEPLVLSSRAA
jgi:hypothetical protein